MNAPKAVRQSGSGVSDKNTNIQFVPNADVISLETIVNMMVNKRICTVEELFMVEDQIQKQNQKNDNNKYLSIHNHYDRGRFPALKRMMSQYRLTRRLGTALFGWKWKKVKKSQASQ